MEGNTSVIREICPLHLRFIASFFFITSLSFLLKGFPGGSDGKESACNAGDLGQEDPLEEGVATHSSILTWRILWSEESGGLQAS